MDVRTHKSNCRFCCQLLVVMLLFLWAAGVEAQTTYYVSPSGSGTPPFGSWSTAATNIQDAIDAASAGDTVLVTNGQYSTGGRAVYGILLDRVALTKALTVSSINGPNVTIIQGHHVPGTTNGDSAVRCAYLTNGAALIGFTLTNGATRIPGSLVQESYGGGVWCESTNATISNCVLMNNVSANHSGGAFYGTLNNCTFINNSAASNGYGGGAYYSTLSNCTLISNSANYGGGAFGGNLFGCTLMSNTTPEATTGAGGGAVSATLVNCTVSGNSGTLGGGGCSSCTLSNCIVSFNTSAEGGGVSDCTLFGCTICSNSVITNGNAGGAYNSTLNNCLVYGNWAGADGGGTYGGTLNNCVLTANAAAYGYGGGAYQGTLNNCTLTGNWAEYAGGGSYSSTLNNCIAYFNTAPQAPNYSNAKTVNYSCTTPDPGGKGNITSDPLLGSDSHLSAASPCRGAGSTAFTNGTDIDGESWANPPSMGADEYHPGVVSGPLSVSINAAWTNGAAGYPFPFTAQINGRTTGSQWSFGDGIILSNEPYATHAWTSPGTYPVVLTAFNEDNPGGISSTTMVQVASAVNLYVSANATHPVAPFASWSTAASNIQDAIDAAASLGGATVWVTNGTYAQGGRVIYGAITNRVVVTTPLVLRSVNGPSVTFIKGQQVAGTMTGSTAVRCIYLTNGATLIGFTLTNGATLPLYSDNQDHETSGGGVWAGLMGVTISNCVITRNAAYHGGGAYGGTFVNCTFTGNVATDTGAVASGGATMSATLNQCFLTSNVAGMYGAGAYSTLNNCILTGNTANSSVGSGGGAAGVCTINNSVVVSNTSASYGGGTYSCTLNNCLLTSNSCMAWGGGAYLGTLSNCTVVANFASSYGGGIYGATAKNCIVYNNTATNGPNYYSGTMTYCCTAPAVSGAGNITNVPAFVDLASHNFMLFSNSPCIDSGNNAFAPGAVDLDHRPRIVGNAVDMGAYEFQGGSTNNYLAWLLSHGLSPDISSDTEDPDGDGMSNWQEWLADTDPTNANSTFRISASMSPLSSIAVSFTSSSNRLYTLLNSTNLAENIWNPISGQVNVPGTGGQQVIFDTTASTIGFYRLSVRVP